MMNREIKFRQPLRNKDGSFKEWFYWGFIDGTFITPANQMNGIDTRFESQQYTGITDIHNKEVYEGDKIFIHYPNSENERDYLILFTVIYELGSFYGDYKAFNRQILLAENRKIEIIGNIFE